MQTMKKSMNSSLVIFFCAAFIFFGVNIANAADSDGDGIDDTIDNCRYVPNPDQSDSDRIPCTDITCDVVWISDGFGDVCDNCPYVLNADQLDSDGDGTGDACENVILPITITLAPENPTGNDLIHLDTRYANIDVPDPDIKIFINRKLENECRAQACAYEGGPFPNGLAYYVEYKGGDGLEYKTSEQYKVVANNDWDNDGVLNSVDNCILTPNADQKDEDVWYCILGMTLCFWKGDGIGDNCDNCPHLLNPDQKDSDKDDVGDACDNCNPIYVDSEQCITARQTMSCSICWNDIVPPGSPPCYSDDWFCKYCCDNSTRNCTANGIAQFDEDNDGVGNACDACPSTPSYIEANIFGCPPCYDTSIGIFLDKTGSVYPDGVPFNALHDHCLDKTHLEFYYCDIDLQAQSDKLTCTNQFGSKSICYNDACRMDKDGDGIPDETDNCPEVSNVSQADSDNDWIGDACDNCPSVYNPDQEDSDNDGIGNACDNCPYKANEDQNDNDGDGIGNVCDNCPEKTSKDQGDSDGDGIGNPCDNCIYYPNAGQKDWDNDGIGNACDCNDGFMGPNETGADCGGICGGQCPDCIPVIVNGNPSDKIDVVFIPDKDYGGNIAQFQKDVMFLIETGYLDQNAFLDSRCKFNFFYYPKEGDYVSVCQKWELPIDPSDLSFFIPFPLKFWKSCGFADSTAIVFTSSGRACAQGGTSIFATSLESRVPVHESGHAIFGLADEYCCDSSYFKPSGHANIFQSLTECQNSSVNPSYCFEFCPTYKCWPGNATEIQNCRNWYKQSKWPALDYECDCKEYAAKMNLDPNQCKPADGSVNCSTAWWPYWQARWVSNVNSLSIQTPNWCNLRGNGIENCCDNGWWKSDPNSCTMVNGTIFQPDCDIKITDKLNSLPACNNPGISSLKTLSLAGQSATADKFIALGYNLKEGVITLLGAVLDYGSTPNYFNEHGRFVVKELSSSGEELFSILLSDPREFRFGYQENFEQGMMMQDDVNFFVLVPFIGGLKTIAIIDVEAGEKVHQEDVTELIEDFCQKTNYQESECQTYTMRVPVDIKPQGCPNPLNIKAKGVLPVAVLGTAHFDVSRINPDSIRLEGIAPERYALEDVGTPFSPFTGKTKSTDCTSAGWDGNTDLTLKFDMKSIVSALGSVKDREVKVLHLSGKLKDGTPIEGEDVVIILKK